MDQSTRPQQLALDFPTTEPEIAYGYCHCGCGDKTRVATRNHSVHGWVKGVPARYRPGHISRGSATCLEKLEQGRTDRLYRLESERNRIAILLCQEEPHLCECGCGLPTPLAKKVDRRWGHEAGRSVRFIHGHHSRIQPLLAERFWGKVLKTDGEGCWEWQASRSSSGYGQIMMVDGERKQPHAAHRIAWELENGLIPDGMFVCHKCDNPPCVRPDHLFLGTAADNHADMVRKGRNVPPPPPATGDESWARKNIEIARSRMVLVRGAKLLNKPMPCAGGVS